MSENEKKKNKFRRTNKWKNFRKELKRKQKTDPVTGSRLSTSCTCHHLDLSMDNYEKVSEDRQVMLNPETHDVVHYFFGDGNRRYNWRCRILNIIRILKRMEKYNGRFDI